jgi:hypothetical protein
MIAFVFIGMLVAGAALGALVARWPVVPVAAGAWPAFMLGLEQGWWGNGVGDGWQVSLVVGAAAGAVGAAFGVWARRKGRPFRSEARAGGLPHG